VHEGRGAWSSKPTSIAAHLCVALDSSPRGGDEKVTVVETRTMPVERGFHHVDDEDRRSNPGSLCRIAYSSPSSVICRDAPRIAWRSTVMTAGMYGCHASLRWPPGRWNSLPSIWVLPAIACRPADSYRSLMAWP